MEQTIDAPQRPNLVIVQAGDQSLHPRWLEGSTGRTWDLWVTYFGDDPSAFRGDAVRFDSKLLKFAATYELLCKQEKLIESYEYILLADDDLLFRGEDITRLFEICKRDRLDLAQPSLSPDSFVAHLITQHNPFFRLRCTSFVESMCPCMTRETLRELRHTIHESGSGWGTDYTWHKLLPNARIAIVDEVQVQHTRDIGTGTTYVRFENRGLVPWDESVAVMRQYGLSRPNVRTHGGKLRAFPSWDLNWSWAIVLLTAVGTLPGALRTKLSLKVFFYRWLVCLWQQIRAAA